MRYFKQWLVVSAAGFPAESCGSWLRYSTRQQAQDEAERWNFAAAHIAHPGYRAVLESDFDGPPNAKHTVDKRGRIVPRGRGK